MVIVPADRPVALTGSYGIVKNGNSALDGSAKCFACLNEYLQFLIYSSFEILKPIKQQFLIAFTGSA